MQMVQGQLDDSTEFGDLLELQEQIRALQQELAEVKQADDEEIEKLLDQNGMACIYHAMWKIICGIPADCAVLVTMLVIAAMFDHW